MSKKSEQERQTYDWWTWETKKKLLENSSNCSYCHVELDRRTATIDHVVPKSKGGGNEMSNLKLSCRTCNGWKGSDSVEDFLRKRKLNKPVLV
jgi:5-methylcytosine-specific restriction endonuclease McrA